MARRGRRRMWRRENWLQEGDWGGMRLLCGSSQKCKGSLLPRRWALGSTGCAGEGWEARGEGPGRSLCHGVSSTCLALLLDPVIPKSQTTPAHPENELPFCAPHSDWIHVLCSRSGSNHLEMTGGTGSVGWLGGGGHGEGLTVCGEHSQVSSTCCRVDTAHNSRNMDFPSNLPEAQRGPLGKPCES